MECILNQVLAMMEIVVNGVSTRKVSAITEELCGTTIYTKVRERGAVRSKGLLVAMGVKEEGYREILGFLAADTESENSWGDFFSSLKDRGLTGVDLVVSDAHKGLVRAIAGHFRGASWQRC